MAITARLHSLLADVRDKAELKILVEDRLAANPAPLNSMANPFFPTTALTPAMTALSTSASSSAPTGQAATPDTDEDKTYVSNSNGFFHTQNPRNIPTPPLSPNPAAEGVSTEMEGVDGTLAQFGQSDLQTDTQAQQMESERIPTPPPPPLLSSFMLKP